MAVPLVRDHYKCLSMRPWRSLRLIASAVLKLTGPVPHYEPGFPAIA
jgi:hypothetical protein